MWGGLRQRKERQEQTHVSTFVKAVWSKKMKKRRRYWEVGEEGDDNDEEEENLLRLCVLQSSSYQPPGLFPSDWHSAGPAFQRGRGLLVQAVRTSQCCESEWHSVTDDLPHGNLSGTLVHRCGPLFFCLAVKIHTALEQDKLILTKSAAWQKTFSFPAVATAFCPPGTSLHVRAVKALRGSSSVSG